MLGLLFGLIEGLIGFSDLISDKEIPSTTIELTSYRYDDIVDVEYEEVN